MSEKTVIFEAGENTTKLLTAFGVELRDMRLAVEALTKALASRPAAPAAGGSVVGPVFPNYGGGKGKPVAGASEGDLNYYRNGAIRSLDDPAKQRFHEKERALLDAIEGEMRSRGFGFAPYAAQGGGSSADAFPSASGAPDESDIPFARHARHGEP